LCGRRGITTGTGD